MNFNAMHFRTQSSIPRIKYI